MIEQIQNVFVKVFNMKGIKANSVMVSYIMGFIMGFLIFIAVIFSVENTA